MYMRKLKELIKVWRLSKKPSKKDFFLTSKIVIVGFIIIGLVGFLMELIWQLVLSNFFK